ncbi:hypothetical protein LTR27_003855 [Elasticomyces elasticus]|nr:hypothetical protein LTR27_003855 [Elasticomyces elasticus]
MPASKRMFRHAADLGSSSKWLPENVLATLTLRAHVVFAHIVRKPTHGTNSNLVFKVPHYALISNLLFAEMTAAAELRRLQNSDAKPNMAYWWESLMQYIEACLLSGEGLYMEARNNGSRGKLDKKSER